METQIILTINTEECGKINMQESLRRNQSLRDRSLLELGKPATRHTEFMIKYPMAGRYSLSEEA